MKSAIAIQWIAHRGFGAIAPENTLAAIRQAIVLGADGIEFDIQRSQDGALVVFHDVTLARTTNGQGRLSDHSLKYLKTLDAGGWFGSEFAGEAIPALTEVLALCAEQEIRLYPEIKATQGWTEAQIRELVTIFDTAQWRDRITICAFDGAFLAQVRALAPRLAVAYGVSTVEQYGQAWVQVQAATGRVALSIADDLLAAHPDWLAAAQVQQVPVLVWTVNNPVRQRELAALGVAGVITDIPLDLRAIE
ncbi:MAG: hypothetical protein F6J87_30655 [Spirulina sp. SIO3F2]|nr:hypothetical protein [Spirulina sp. SIO3F2]